MTATARRATTLSSTAPDVPCGASPGGTTVPAASSLPRPLQWFLIRHGFVRRGAIEREEDGLLGYMGHEDWHDMSEYVVHLTDRYGIQGVFGTGAIEAGAATGVVRNRPELGDSQMSVCLSEIPLGHLDRLAERHGAYGVGFAKRFIESRGGQMVTYLRKDTPGAMRFQAVVTAAMRGSIDPNDPLWNITQFYDNPGEYGHTRYEFDWEREWRVPQQLQFSENEVTLLLAPEGHHQWMRETAWRRLAAPAYRGAMLDPRWNIHRIQQELIVNGNSLA